MFFLSNTCRGGTGIVIVQGEISGFKRHHQSGHIYFDLKDAEARIRVALFKKRVRGAHDALADGIAVQVEGQIDFYGPRGEISLLAERVSQASLSRLRAPLRNFRPE